MTRLQYDLGLGGGTLLQIANRSLSQMMSYIIDCPNGGTVVIDGGMYCDEDAEHLYSELEKRGKRVDFWFFTHCHVDHYGAWLKLAQRENFDIDIGNLCFNFPSHEWLMTKEDRIYTEEFLAFLDRTDFPVTTPRYGDSFSCGGITIEILSEPRNYENYRSINPTGIILKVHFPNQSVLFLGDYDIDAEEDFKQYFSTEKLRCDIVQMAHHGQDGVSKEFYELIKPKYCLYTAPDWLWENNKGFWENDNKKPGPETRGQGRFTTLDTRLWMAELRVIRSFHFGDGDWLFR